MNYPSKDNPFMGLKRSFYIFPTYLKELGLCEYQFCIIDLVRRKTRHKQYCKCKNKHFAEFLGISEPQVTYYIRPLIASGWLCKSNAGYFFDDWPSTDAIFGFHVGYKFYVLFLDILIEYDLTLFQYAVLYEIYYIKHERRHQYYKEISIQKMCKEMGFSRNGFKDVTNMLVFNGMATWQRGTSEIQLSDAIVTKIETAQIQNSITKS